MGKKGTPVNRRMFGRSPDRANIRKGVARLFGEYLEKEKLSVGEFARRYHDKFGYKDRDVGRNTFTDLHKGRSIGQNCEDSEGFPFREDELIKYKTLFEIIGVSQTDEIVLKLRQKCSDFEYGDNKRRISAWNPETPPVKEITGPARRKSYL